ncbi:transmembrane protein 135-like isoform X2 [Venturia canescens]|uniref:transmembrane protein 135-like isoform X2 n=1 Tax=Venturia canescens TaxID=32260 RepID=UPI001C9D0F5F|nr:transmembrane protein 135-like isoform X2 [Venturia canescens]
MENHRTQLCLCQVTLLMKGKVPSSSDIKRTILGILQSTAFLSWSSFTYSMFICFLRRLLGNFNVLSVSFFPSFLSSLSAILIERPSRRTLLCLYVSNIATETLFRMGVWRGYYSVLPRGELYIFSASMATLLYLFRSKSNKQDSIYKIIRYIVGSHEEENYLEKQRSKPCETFSYNWNSDQPGPSNQSSKKNSSKSMFHIAAQALKIYQLIINRIKGQSRHATCPHPFSCAHYILAGTAKLFSVGVAAQLALQLVFRSFKIIKKPQILGPTIFNKKNFNLALFLGGFSGLYRLVSCSLRSACNKDSKYHAIPAGFVASIAFMMYPNNTAALYVMWKALQLLWNREVENGKVPELKWFSILLYSFSTALLFHAAIIEPQNLRPSYWKFLCNLSGGRVAAMDRSPLDRFGYDSSAHLQEVLRKTQTTDKITLSF